MEQTNHAVKSRNNLQAIQNNREESWPRRDPAAPTRFKAHDGDANGSAGRECIYDPSASWAPQLRQYVGLRQPERRRHSHKSSSVCRMISFRS